MISKIVLAVTSNLEKQSIMTKEFLVQFYFSLCREAGLAYFSHFQTNLKFNCRRASFGNLFSQFSRPFYIMPDQNNEFNKRFFPKKVLRKKRSHLCRLIR